MDKKGYILVIITLLLFALYLPLDVVRPSLYNFKTPIDDTIPIMTIFVIFYLSYFVFLAFTLIYFAKKAGSKIINQTLLAIIISCLTAYAFFLLFQNKVERPVLPVIEDIFDQTYLWLNANVPPYNGFPSLHVAISTICLMAYFKIKSGLKNWVALWVVLIILSTLYTKQHYFLDVIAGLILGPACFYLSKKILKKYG